MDKLDPRDVAVIRMLAGANFLGGQVTLPSGRVLGPKEMQALTSAYAPAVGEREKVAEQVDTAARELAAEAAGMAGRMPREGESLLAHHLANGGDPGNERTMAILRAADRGRARRAARVEPPASAAPPSAVKTLRWWRGYDVTFYSTLALALAAAVLALLGYRGWANLAAIAAIVVAVARLVCFVVAIVRVNRDVRARRRR